MLVLLFFQNEEVMSAIGVHFYFPDSVINMWNIKINVMLKLSKYLDRWRKYGQS